MNIAVLGAGMVGNAITLDLAAQFSVTAFDKNQAALQQLKIANPNIKTSLFNLQDYHLYHQYLNNFDVIISAVPGFMGYETLKTLITLGKPIADISFFPEDALTLNRLAVENNVTAIVDCGVAPGMSNLILGYYDSKITVESFECMVGGLPKNRIFPFEYKAPFSPIDVIEEYTRMAYLKENGQIIARPALSDAELIDFPHAGTLEAFNTDGLRTLLTTLPHIPFMKEKTLRYPGHIRWIQGLMKAGFFSTTPVTVNGKKVVPMDLTSTLLFDQWKLQPDEPEFTLMKILIKGNDKNGTKEIECLLYNENEAETGLSSMSKTTGYACTAMVHLLHRNKISKTGILPPELIGADEECFRFIIDHLAQRKVHYSFTVSKA